MFQRGAGYVSHNKKQTSRLGVATLFYHLPKVDTTLLSRFPFKRQSGHTRNTPRDAATENPHAIHPKRPNVFGRLNHVTDEEVEFDVQPSVGTNNNYRVNKINHLCAMSERRQLRVFRVGR